jgi:hypothetical protein
MSRTVKRRRLFLGRIGANSSQWPMRNFIRNAACQINHRVFSQNSSNLLINWNLVLRHRFRTDHMLIFG